MYFKQFVNFAKDAINTIAPSLSSQNKFNAQTAGLIDQTPYAEQIKPFQPYQPKPKKSSNKSKVKASLPKSNSKVPSPKSEPENRGEFLEKIEQMNLMKK